MPLSIGPGALRVGSRRWFLETSLAGLGGVTLTHALGRPGTAASLDANKKSVILFWLSGGPSHLDLWDPKEKV